MALSNFAGHLMYLGTVANPGTAFPEEYIELNSKLQGFPCIKSQKNTGAKYTYDHNYGVSTNGKSVVVGSRLSGSTDMGSTSTEYTGKTQYLCSGKGASLLDCCDRRKQLDCDGRKIYR